MQNRQIRKTSTFRPPEGVSTRRAQKLAEVYAIAFEEKCRGQLSLNENMRFSELFHWYFEQIAPNYLKAHSIISNRYLLETYVLPQFGRLRLRDITTPRIDALLAELSSNGSRRELYKLSAPQILSTAQKSYLIDNNVIDRLTLKAMCAGRPLMRRTADKICTALTVPRTVFFRPWQCGKGLSPGSIRRIRATLSPLFTAAMRKGILSYNPVLASTPPKAEQKDRSFLDASGCRQLLCLTAQMPNPQHPHAIELLLLTGMRVGELLALHWQDIDFSASMINIQHTLCRINGTYCLTAPKTKSSLRRIAVPQRALSILSAQQNLQERLAKKAGEKWITTGAVFTSQNGDYMNAAYLNNAFRRLLRQNSMPPIHIHDLRHANASLLINMGIPIKLVSAHLGHLDTKTTETVYTHLFQETKSITAYAIIKALDLPSKPYPVNSAAVGNTYRPGSS